tara:strand:+ start:3868 stop:4017 length:150 start_codon:yes stop_codon:yes gene_type:complete
MQRQKTKRRKSKKNKNKLTDLPIEYQHYQPNNPLTKYFAKLIEKQPKIK